MARILANAFAMDGDGSEPVPGPEEIERLLAEAEARAGSAFDPAFSAEDMWDVQEVSHLRRVRPARLLRVAAVLLGPGGRRGAETRSGRSGRAAFHPVGPTRKADGALPFAASHLSKLGNVQEAFLPLTALTPREVSIIDVQTLKELDGEGMFEAVEVRTAAGAAAAIPRGELTALVAEMIVPMAERPWAFMSDTDLLDFPGTRNRFTYDLANYLEAGESPLAQLFLRGKVAYLFDRYVAEQELTSMLLCIGDGNMEAKDLPGLIDRWVVATHGATPEERMRPPDASSFSC